MRGPGPLRGMSGEPVPSGRLQYSTVFDTKQGHTRCKMGAKTEKRELFLV